jgi:hypothetical protein
LPINQITVSIIAGQVLHENMPAVTAVGVWVLDTLRGLRIKNNRAHGMHMHNGRLVEQLVQGKR